MKRTICQDCNKQVRSRNTTTTRCRKCLNKVAPGMGNRPNKGPFEIKAPVVKQAVMKSKGKGKGKGK